ncbi:hypothetical protein [Pedobacter panaciterrae]
MNFRYLRIAIFTLCMLFSINIFAVEGVPALIPQPVKFQRLPGSFKISKTTKLIAAPANKEIAELFAAMIKVPTGFTLSHASGEFQPFS